MDEHGDLDTRTSRASFGTVGRASLIFGAAHIVGLGVVLALVVAT